MNHAEQYLTEQLTEMKDKLNVLETQEAIFLKANASTRADLVAKIADLVDALEKLAPAKPAAKKTAASKK